MKRINQPETTIYKSTLEENQRSQIGTLFNVATPFYFGPSNLFRPKPKTGKNETTTTSTKAKTLSISLRFVPPKSQLHLHLHHNHQEKQSRQ